jgi:hypothetical protein
MRVLECKVVSKVESTGHTLLRVSLVKWNSVACVAVTCNRWRWWRSVCCFYVQQMSLVALVFLEKSIFVPVTGVTCM